MSDVHSRISPRLMGAVLVVLLGVLTPQAASAVNSAPINLGLTPSGGPISAGPVTFTGIYRDPDGYGTLSKCYLLINDSVTQANAAFLLYDRAANRVYLKNDANSSWGTGYAPGTNVTLENTQCQFSVKDTSVSGSGTDLTVNWRIALKSPFSGRLLNGYMYVQDAGSLTDGWDMLGIYYNIKPQVVSISPDSGLMPVDTKTSLTSLYRDPNGCADLRKCYMLVNDVLAQTNAVFGFYDRTANKVYLKNDANTSWGTGYTPGTDVTLSNSQCEMYVKDTSRTLSGTDLTVVWSFKLKPSMTGKNLYSWMYAADTAAAYDGWKKVGTHFIPAAPTCAGVTPSSGSVQAGPRQVFTAEYDDDNGPADIYQCYLQISQYSSQANAVLLLYDLKKGLVFLRNDANNSWGTGQAPGTGLTLENSQCAVHVKDIVIAESGPNSLTIDWNLSLKPGLVPKLLCERMYCRDNEYLNSGWKVKGYVRAQYYPMEMISIPAGSFLMGNNGSEPYGNYDELPQHSVDLPAYYIGKYEVTRGQYRQFMEAGGYSTPGYWSSDGWSWIVASGRTAPNSWDADQDWGSGTFTQTDDHPVVGVLYYEAEAFCNWAGGYLPTEEQWEKAARWTGAYPSSYPWGNVWAPERLNGAEDGNPAAGGYGAMQTAPVGSYPDGASPYGCMDMAGNASEWCGSWYVSYPGNPSPFDQTGVARIRRGGSWAAGQANQGSPFRGHSAPYLTSNWVGFRMAR
jgi:formylglycine-generating enzyme required for sulfatase activity